MLDKRDALTGALVADAAALGLHWLYDQEQIARLETTGSLLFRQPDKNVYENVSGFFAQGGRVAGQLSHYGESARLVAKACAAGTYSTLTHREFFLETFGPCGSFNGYADRPTKALIAQMLTSDVDAIQDPSGIDDDQLPGLCPVAALYAGGLPLGVALSAVQVLSINSDVSEGSTIIYSCLDALLQGINLKDALHQTAAAGSSALHTLLQEALAVESYQPLETANRFGLACHLPQGLPLVWHLLNHSDGFEMAVRDNIRCGGDSCGRAMALGALAGVAYGVPESLVQRMAADTV